MKVARVSSARGVRANRVRARDCRYSLAPRASWPLPKPIVSLSRAAGLCSFLHTYSLGNERRPSAAFKCSCVSAARPADACPIVSSAIYVIPSRGGCAQGEITRRAHMHTSACYGGTIVFRCPRSLSPLSPPLSRSRALLDSPLRGKKLANNGT